MKNFRNYGWLDIDFQPGLNLFIGNNAQGKTNLLEAIYFLSTLKSFRGATASDMIKQTQDAFIINASVMSDIRHDIKIYCSKNLRKITFDNHTINRTRGIYGFIKSVVFCSEDMQLIKGSAKVRRRYVDFILANTNQRYLDLLQNYVKAVKTRNSILKQNTIDFTLLESFSQQMVKSGEEIIRWRKRLFEEISSIIQTSYAKVSSSNEEIDIHYKPSVKTDFRTELLGLRERELTLRTTIIGPHRDDFEILINNKPADAFASEGQIRTIAIALKIAQTEYFTQKHGVPPIMLIDDVMGELDKNRRSAFLPLLQRSQYHRSQVFMTCTEQSWHSELKLPMEIWNVFNGSLRKK